MYEPHIQSDLVKRIPGPCRCRVNVIQIPERCGVCMKESLGEPSLIGRKQN